MEYDHINKTSWPDERLYDRMIELVDINKPWQSSPERVTAIKHEMACISFEQQARYAETHPNEELVADISSIKVPKPGPFKK